MEITVFGLANEDSVLPALRKRFPGLIFRKHDIRQEIEGEGGTLIAMDTVKGISCVMLLTDLSEFSPGRSLEGSGAIMTLRILLRIGSLSSVRLIAVPEDYPPESVIAEAGDIIRDELKG